MLIAAMIVMTALFCLLAEEAEALEAAPAPVRPSAPTYVAARVPRAPRLDPTDELWGRAEDIGPFFAGGAIEPAEGRTQIRMLLCDGTLYISALCGGEDGPGEGAGTGVDSLAFYFSQRGDRQFPYVRIEITAAGAVTADLYFRPYKRWREPIPVEHLDASPIQLRTGRNGSGWWAAAAVPLDGLDIPESAFRANIVRTRPGGGPPYAWVDLGGMSVDSGDDFGMVTAADAPLAPRPRLALPAAVAVGANELRFSDWRPGCSARANGAAVDVGPDGAARLIVERRGLVSLEVTDAAGLAVTTYSANVRRPLVVEAAEPFEPDVAKPLRVAIALNIVGAGSAAVTVEARQVGELVGRTHLSLAAGVHEIEVPLTGVKRGEIEIAAAAEVPVPGGNAVGLRAGHWCVRGAESGEFDRFRDGIDELSTRSLYRAGLADACGFHRLIQAGDGRYRHSRREGRLGFSEWNHCLVYAFALLYKTDWPENPHFGDGRFLTSAVAGMEAGLDPESRYVSGGYSRHLQAYLLTYELLKDDVAPEIREYWRRRLTDIVGHTVDRYVHPATYLYTFYSLDVGTGTNHYAYYVANVYTAGRVLERRDWLELGRERMLALAGHEQDGHFPERRGVPATHYTWLSMNGLGQYWAQSGDDSVAAALKRCVEFSCHTTLPDLDIILLHDGRNNSYHRYDFGDFVLGLAPRGRRLARRRAEERIASARRPSQSGPEYWFRTAENALYFRDGDEEEMPADTEFAFLDGRGLVVRRHGFIYGLSAICVPPTDEEFWLDPQNTVELHHAAIGPILHGANSLLHPEGGSFHRKLADRTVFLPDEGMIEKTQDGHFARLDFDTFAVRLTCRVLSETAAEIKVELLHAEGEEPVVFSFFPAVTGDDELVVTDDGGGLEFGRVRIESNRPVEIERGFQITNPYGLRRDVRTKPVRAYLTLEEKQPLVIRVSLSEGND